MPTTPNRGIPYQATSDAPDGAELGRELAQRLDAPLPVMEVFEIDDTWTKPPGLVAIKVRAVGGGGAGGGSQGAATGESSVGGGGNAGVYGEVVIQAANLAATETVTVGTGGLGVAGGHGENGGTTAFGTHMSLPGGEGGKMQEAATGTLVTLTNAPTGGGSGFDIRVEGRPGSFGVSHADNEARRMSGGMGGSSPLGAGGNGNRGGTPGGGADGAGSGGGGSSSREGDPSRAGGGGSHGLVIVEYIY